MNGRPGLAARHLTLDSKSTYVTRDAHGVFHARFDVCWDRGYEMPAHQDSVRRRLLEH